MVGLLSRRAAAALTIAVLACAPPASAQPDAGSGRHSWSIAAAIGVPDPNTPLRAWPEGGHGKLRAEDEGAYLDRLVAEYRGRITPTLEAHVVADYLDDDAGGLDLTEAYLEWRPVPRRALKQQWRFGGFYPRMSLENVDAGWASPLSTSFSAVNTWLGEEIRAFGAEWLGRRTLGPAASPHELAFFSGLFYGNDPAGTLLFWRGWSVHDRQTRFGDRLPLPPRPVFGAGGAIVGLAAQTVEPFAEIDERPGVYGGLEWRLRRRALVRLSRYDNRAAPLDFESGQWSWNTTFDQLAVQVELPLGLGLVAQHLTGRTIWLVGGGTDGVASPRSYVAEDDFSAHFVLLTKRIRDRHRVTLRRDEFDVDREASPNTLTIDSGGAWTVSYGYRPSERLSMTLEWLEIESRRDLWPAFYALPAHAEERQLKLTLGVRLRSTNR